MLAAVSGTEIGRPPVLRAGDTVRLVSPSGPTRPERVARAIAWLTDWGLRVEIAPHAYDRNGYFAGTDADRLADLNAALADPSVRGIVCTRGGYGVQRIVDGLDLAAVRADPKVVVGFSDLTSLHLALWCGARLATVHGPAATMLDDRMPAHAVAALRAAVMSTDPVTVASDPTEETAAVRVDGPPVRGTLLGGNLSMLTASVGTRDLPDLTGAILLLEDIAEAPYRVDRMLTHLRRAGVLGTVAGLAIGQFTACVDDWPVSIVDVLVERLGDLGVPVLGGLPLGHGDAPLSVPMGVPAVLDAAAGTLVAEPATGSSAASSGSRAGSATPRSR
jgi:muramoyltetrapeptide carboxypeptidase